VELQFDSFDGWSLAVQKPYLLADFRQPAFFGEFPMKTSRVICLAVIVVSWLCNDAAAEDFEVRSDDVTYSDAGGKEAVGFFARPVTDEPRPGIVLIHEWWGLNQDIKNKATEFAKLGYVALAVDLYGGEVTTDPAVARELAGKVRGEMDVAQENLQDAINWLKKSKHADPERLASIGWCFGGGWSYQIAKNNLGVKASVIYYGFFNPEDDLQKMRADIIGHFAEEDRAIAIDSVKEFQAKLKTLNGDHEIYIYPNTTHGFASRPGNNPQYNEEAAKLAWERTLAFLQKHL
jgi:carboxymethylenebutenolidase